MRLSRRQQQILRLLREGQYREVKDLAELLNVDGSTVRRDLQTLSGLGLIRRLHGGAQLAEHPAFEDEAPETVAIAHSARSLVSHGSRIALGSGPITDRLLPLLADVEDLTVLTHDLGAATILARSPGVRLLFAGGELRSHAATLVGAGPCAVDFASTQQIDVALIEAEAVDPEAGVTCSRSWLADVHRAMLSASSRRCVLVQGRAFGRRQPFPVAPASWVDLYLTGEVLPDEALPAYGGHVARAAIDSVVLAR